MSEGRASSAFQKPQVTASVHIPNGSRVTVRLGEQDAVELDPSLVTDLFLLGLQIPDADSTGRASVGTLEIDDQVRFRVGATDLPSSVALEALARGVGRALDRAVEDLREGDRGEARTDSSTHSSGTMPHRRRRTVQTVTLAELESDFDTLVARVTDDAVHLTITEDGHPVAVLVPWAWYRRKREALAKIDAAYWQAWSDDGQFDAAGHAAAIADLDIKPTD